MANQAPSLARQIGGFFLVAVLATLAAIGGAWAVALRYRIEDRAAREAHVFDPQTTTFRALPYPVPLWDPSVLLRADDVLTISSSRSEVTHRFDVEKKAIVKDDAPHPADAPMPDLEGHRTLPLPDRTFLFVPASEEKGEQRTRIGKDANAAKGPLLAVVSDPLATRMHDGRIVVLDRATGDLFVAADGDERFVKLSSLGPVFVLALVGGDARVIVLTSRDDVAVESTSIDAKGASTKGPRIDGVTACGAQANGKGWVLVTCSPAKPFGRVFDPEAVKVGSIAAAVSLLGLVGLVVSYRKRLASLGVMIAGTIVGTAFGALVVYVVGALARAAHGRPLRRRGRVVCVGVTARSSRRARSDVGPYSRRVLAALWRRDATLEHASIAAFRKLAQQLRALGAEGSLVATAERSALEEARHAREAFALASTYGDVELAGAELPHVVLESRDLALSDLARESMLDGCLGEAVSAELAAAAAREATDPCVRSFLEGIVEDERGHAELAWNVVAFALRRGGASVQREIERAVREVARARPPSMRTWLPSRVARAHGRLDAKTARAVFDQVRARVIARARSLDLDLGEAATRLVP